MGSSIKNISSIIISLVFSFVIFVMLTSISGEIKDLENSSENPSSFFSGIISIIAFVSSPNVGSTNGFIDKSCSSNLNKYLNKSLIKSSSILCELSVTCIFSLISFITSITSKFSFLIILSLNFSLYIFWISSTFLILDLSV